MNWRTDNLIMRYIILRYIRDLLGPQHDLLLGNLALRQQILVLERQLKRPKFNNRERVFWVVFSRYWPGRKNPLWGAPRIPGELIMLGYNICESTVAKYMIKRKDRPTQIWKTFLQNHLGEIAAIDFLTVPTVAFKTLYVFVVLSLDRRRVIHFHVTTHPTSDWTALQLVQAFPFGSAPIWAWIRKRPLAEPLSRRSWAR